ncbi:MAG TPA: hypothetical protein PKY30_24090 [Myxococcota bacterium]|nr:hypothetical protein [Myxococcota bacterium]
MGPLSILCSLQQTEVLTLSCVIKNQSDNVVHILNHSPLPYRIPNLENQVLFLWGVNRPPADADVDSFDLPLTRALSPGEQCSYVVPVFPMVFRDHYGTKAVATIRYPLQIQVQVAWGHSAITAKDQARMGMGRFFAWQQLQDGPLLHLLGPG